MGQKGKKSPAAQGCRNGSLEYLQTILGVAELDQPPQYEGAWLPLKVINVLRQPRDEFDDIPQLAASIRRSNLLHPIVVGRFSAEDCDRFLEAHNRLWEETKTRAALMSVLEGGEEVFYILHGGERRLRAHKLLERKKVEVRLARNLTPLHALFLQLAENTHVRVPPEKEARVYTLLLRLIRLARPKFPLAEFAEYVGRGEEAIRNALRFSNLPREIQEAVEKKRLRYGMAVEIGRLQEAGVKPGELRMWMLGAMVKNGNYSVEEFRKRVRKYLDEIRSGQLSLLDTFKELQAHAERLTRIRRPVALNIALAVWRDIGYFRRVLELFEQGLLGKLDSPFSHASTVRIFRIWLNVLRRVTPHLKGLTPRHVLRDGEMTFWQVEAELERILRLIERGRKRPPARITRTTPPAGRKG